MSGDALDFREGVEDLFEGLGAVVFGWREEYGSGGCGCSGG